MNLADENGNKSSSLPFLRTSPRFKFLIEKKQTLACLDMVDSGKSHRA